MGRHVIRTSGWLILAATALLVLGCSAAGPRIKAYSGPELKGTETATLEAPANIRVLRINGEEMTSFLLKDLALQYSLKPGPNDVVFRYRSIWAKKGVRRDGDPAVETVESAPMIASFQAQPGQTYTFRFEEADNVREARALAETFSAELVADTRAVAVAERAGAQSGSHRPVAAKQSDGNAATGSTAVPQDLSTLEALKLLWKRASKEEKEAFLQQAFD